MADESKKRIFNEVAKKGFENPRWEPSEISRGDFKGAGPN